MSICIAHYAKTPLMC